MEVAETAGMDPHSAAGSVAQPILHYKSGRARLDFHPHGSGFRLKCSDWPKATRGVR